MGIGHQAERQKSRFSVEQKEEKQELGDNLRNFN